MLCSQDGPKHPRGGAHPTHETQHILRGRHRTLARCGPRPSRLGLPPATPASWHTRAHGRLRHAAGGQPHLRRLRRRDAQCRQRDSNGDAR